MHRRQFLQFGVGATLGSAAAVRFTDRAAEGTPPAYSVIPVVGDGKFIWNKPPQGETGYLEPRRYELSIGIELEGTGNATQVQASTPIPVQHPEQRIDSFKIETQNCVAEARPLAEGAGQLIMGVPRLLPEQKAFAIARYELTLLKQYHGYQRDQFAVRQEVPREVTRSYLQDSPGIQTRSKQVRDLAEQLGRGQSHPWDRARNFARWIRSNIRAQVGPYTSVTAALENCRGDCEEMAALFVALCRAVDIPARLVWVPNHNWSEMYLTDEEGQGHWIPVHTASYFWFGWTGAHELVLQKGDRIRVPQQHKTLRLLEDWMQWMGRKPRARYLGELQPLPAEEGQNAGPGQRSKDDRGEWKLAGNHPLDGYMRK